MPDAELLTTTEVARILRVSTRTVARWVELGDLPAIKLPSGQLRFHRDEVEKLLRQGRSDQG